MAEYTLKLGTENARRLSYAIGRSDEANALVEATKRAAMAAEQGVRELILLLASQQEIKLPEQFNLRFPGDDVVVVVERLTGNENIPMNGKDLIPHG